MAELSNIHLIYVMVVGFTLLILLFVLLLLYLRDFAADMKDMRALLLTRNYSPRNQEAGGNRGEADHVPARRKTTSIPAERPDDDANLRKPITSEPVDKPRSAEKTETTSKTREAIPDVTIKPGVQAAPAIPASKAVSPRKQVDMAVDDFLGKHNFADVTGYLAHFEDKYGGNQSTERLRFACLLEQNLSEIERWDAGLRRQGCTQSATDAAETIVEKSRTIAGEAMAHVFKLLLRQKKGAVDFDNASGSLTQFVERCLYKPMGPFFSLPASSQSDLFYSGALDTRYRLFLFYMLAFRVHKNKRELQDEIKYQGNKAIDEAIERVTQGTREIHQLFGERVVAIIGPLLQCLSEQKHNGTEAGVSVDLLCRYFGVTETVPALNKSYDPGRQEIVNTIAINGMPDRQVNHVVANGYEFDNKALVKAKVIVTGG